MFNSPYDDGHNRRPLENDICLGHISTMPPRDTSCKAGISGIGIPVRRIIPVYLMNIRTLLPKFIAPVTALAILAVSAGIIAYGRGYRLDIRKKALSPTGLIAATSDPTGAAVFVDGRKVTATSANLNIRPGWYTVTIVKDGYQPWEKRLRVQGEVVARADATLFAANPSLAAITAGGAIRPVLSPDGTRLAYIIPQAEATGGAQLVGRAGIWVLDLIDKPLGLNRDAMQVMKAESLDVSRLTLSWSPDSKQLLVTEHPVFGQQLEYLISPDTAAGVPKPVLDPLGLAAEWDDLTRLKEKERMLALKEDLVAVATSSMRIISFSPDETKILYEASAAATIPQILVPAKIGTNPTEETRTLTPGTIYVYDIKEDRNYALGDAKTLGFANPTPTPAPTAPARGIIAPRQQEPVGIPLVHTSPAPVQWLPTSKHLIVVGGGRIDVMEFDGANRKTVYAGPFVDGFVVPWTTAGKLVILTNFNMATSTMPNLYAVNIR